MRHFASELAARNERHVRYSDLQYRLEVDEEWLRLTEQVEITKKGMWDATWLLNKAEDAQATRVIELVHQIADEGIVWDDPATDEFENRKRALRKRELREMARDGLHD